MLIKVTSSKAHEAFAAFLEKLDHNASGVWRLAIIPGLYLGDYDPDRVVVALKLVMPSAKDINVYFMDNRDIYIVWQGRVNPQELRTLVLAAFAKPGLSVSPEKLVLFHDPKADTNELLIALSRQFGKDDNTGAAALPAAPAPSKPKVELPTALTGIRREMFENALKSRLGREKPLVLMVEDQEFSRKLLTGVLEEHFSVLASANGLEGWWQFVDNAPDAVFLDIELLDISGHDLANRIKAFAPDTYVVMVTGNNSIEDVQKARNNKVDGFIVKPYSKQKILDCIGKFRAQHKVLSLRQR